MLENRNSYSVAVGAVIRAELARRNLPISALLSVINVSRGSLYARVRGVAPFNIVELHQVADFFGMSMVELIQEARVAA